MPLYIVYNNNFVIIILFIITAYITLHLHIIICGCSSVLICSFVCVTVLYCGLNMDCWKQTQHCFLLTVQVHWWALIT